MSFPRYPAYKASGVEWLGEVPGHWEVPPLYLRYEVVLGKMLDTQRLTGEYPLPYLRNVDVQWDRVNTVDLPEMDIKPSEAERFTLRAGDLLVCEGGEVGRSALWRGELARCAFQKAIHRLRPLSSKEDPRYLFHCMQFGSAVNIFVVDGNPNTIPHLTGEMLRLYRFPRPPSTEQALIAAFLDRETAKIDALVAEQQRLMDLLKEKRQAVISHAVTKGLNPDAPMKPSGIEWLGDVPAHWKVSLLKRAFRSVDYGISDALRAEGEIAILRMGNIVNGRVLMDDLKYTDSVDRALLLHHGDLLYNRTNSLDLIGKVGMFREEGRARVSFASYLVRLQTVEQSVPEYFAYLLNTEDILGLARSNAFVAIGQCNLNPTRYGQILVAIPPRVEQVAIASLLDTATARLDTLTTEAQRAIDLLQERRTALISAAVTGQIDVRNLASAEAT